jgi:large subunit ribosomal protein L4
MAFSDKLATNSLVIVDNLEFGEYKTKKFNEMLTSFEKNVLNNERRNILIVNEAKEEKAKYSSRNLQGVKILNLENINLVDLLNYKNLLLTESVVKILTDRYNK